MKTKDIRVRVTEEEKAIIDKIAKDKGITVSDLVRQVLIYKNIKL